MINQDFLSKTIEIIKKISTFITSEQQKITAENIKQKGNHDFVTYVDKNAEKKLVTELQKILPEAGFITEEKTTTKKGNTYTWIIDPLDGTTNYIHKLTPIAISVALQKNEKTILGIIHEISHNETFYAIENQNAYLNDKKITIGTNKKLNEALIATGFQYLNNNNCSKYIKILSELSQKTHGIRSTGSAATDLAYIACGRIDAFYEYGLKPWDVAAGAFIIKQAGGKITDFNGQENYIHGNEIIATNSKIYPELITQINNSIKNEK